MKWNSLRCRYDVLLYCRSTPRSRRRPTNVDFLLDLGMCKSCKLCVPTNQLLPSVFRAAPASMGMTRRGKIPLRPTATEATSECSHTWACSLAKKSATARKPGRSSVRLRPGPAAVAMAWAMVVCDIFWLLDAPLRVSTSRDTGINRAATAQQGFPQHEPFILPTVWKGLASSEAAGTWGTRSEAQNSSRCGTTETWSQYWLVGWWISEKFKA